MRDQNLHATKQTIRKFLADQRFFDDGALVKLLDAARAGEMEYTNPFGCLVGRSNVDYVASVQRGLIDTSWSAGTAFFLLGNGGIGNEFDLIRQRRLIPMIKSEMRNRARSLTQSLEPRRRFVEPTIERATRFEFVD